MNKRNENKTSVLLIINNLIKNNLKFILIFLGLVFVIFLLYQSFSYYKISSIKKNSIVYFDAKSLEDKIKTNQIMEELSIKNNFYSILASLELINDYLENNNYEIAKETYIKLLKNSNLDKLLISTIASKASYTFINIQNENLSLNFLDDIGLFIEFISDDLNNFKEIKMELRFLKLVSEIDKNKISYQDSKEAIALYNNIVESENISSIIKERVKKIHEFQLYK